MERAKAKVVPRRSAGDIGGDSLSSGSRLGKATQGLNQADLAEEQDEEYQQQEQAEANEENQQQQLRQQSEGNEDNQQTQSTVTEDEIDQTREATARIVGYPHDGRSSTYFSARSSTRAAAAGARRATARARTRAPAATGRERRRATAIQSAERGIGSRGRKQRAAAVLIFV